MKKLRILAITILLISSSAGASKLDWNQDLMTHTCSEAVKKQVTLDASKNIDDLIQFDVISVHAQLLADDSFVCLVVGDQREIKKSGVEQREAKAYSAIVKPFPKLRVRVQAVPSL